MRQSMTCAAFAAAAIVWAAGATTAPAAKASDELANPGFEEVTPKGMPAGWGLPQDMRENSEVIADAEQAKEGDRFLLYRPGQKIRYCYSNDVAVKPGKVNISLWAKGDGMCYFLVRLTNTEGKNPELIGRDASKKIEVKPDEWLEVSKEVEIPATVTKDGKEAKVDAISLQIGVRGEVALDAVSIEPVP